MGEMRVTDEDSAADAAAVSAIIDSPVGPLALAMRGAALTHLWFPPVTKRQEGQVPPGRRVDAREHPALADAAAQLAQYFAGERTSFDLELDPAGGDFESRVWHRLTQIPYGETATYGQVARDVGEPGGAQAVGRAVGANPIGIVIPCHRVIGADGSMTGFAGGLACKTYLLDLEGYVTGRTLLPPHL